MQRGVGSTLGSIEGMYCIVGFSIFGTVLGMKEGTREGRDEGS